MRIRLAAAFGKMPVASVMQLCFAVLLAAAIAFADRADGTIQLTVERDQITAGDLAKVIPAWNEIDPLLVLGYAPRPGVRRRVKRPQILSWAKRHGLSLHGQSLPAALVVSRRMRRLEAAEAIQHLTAGAAERYGVHPSQVKVILKSDFEPLVPAGPLTFQFGGSVNQLNKAILAPLRWTDSEGHSGKVLLRASFSILAQSAVAKADLATGSELSPEDFQFREGPLPGPPNRFLITPEDLSGKELNVRLQAGSVLEWRMLAEQQTIRRGDLIQLELHTHSVVLRVPGRAEQSGQVGDRIRCRNLESGRQVLATIVDSKSAEVISNL